MQVLTDTYGRILTQHDPDGDVRTAVVWVPGDSRIDWDDASDQELVTLLSKYGYNDALTIVNKNVTINTNGETETLTWDSVAMDFNVDVDMFQNGTQNMYFRTVNDGNRDVTVLVDADGKAIQAQTLGGYTNVLFTVANNGTEIDTVTEGDSISREGIINACGGAVNVSALDAGESVFLLVMGAHIQYCNSDNTNTSPSVSEWVRPVGLYVRANKAGGPPNYLVDEQGRALHFTYGESGAFYMCNINNGQYGIEGSVPGGWFSVDIPFNGASTSNGSFVYNGITYSCVNSVMSPVVNTPFE